MPVQIITTRLLSQKENIWLTSLTDRLKATQLEKVVLETQKLSVKIGALIYAMAVANPVIFKEEYGSMGTSLEAVFDEIGFVDKKEVSEKIAKLALEAELAKLEKTQAVNEKAQIEQEIAKVEQKKVKAEQEKAQVEQEKAQVEEKNAQVEEKNAKLLAENNKHKKNQLEAAFDMLLHGTPVPLVSKWTSIPEDEIRKMKADIEITYNDDESK